MKNKAYDVIIIGRGVAGLAAAIYSGRFKLKTLVIGDKKGGTIVSTHEVANYPGFKKITGMDLVKNIEEHAKQYEVDFATNRVVEIKRNKTCFNVKTNKEQFSGRSIIYATGGEWRKLNVPGEQEFRNLGVSYCGLCDAPLYRNKIIGVVGGSDSAAKEALLLARYAKKVYIIYRKEKIRAEPVTYEELMKDKKIEIINNTNVKEIKGDKVLKSVILDKSHKGKKELELGGLFIEIGSIPLSDLAKKIGVKTNKKGEIMIDRESKTNVPGFCAAGDVTDTKFKQAITGVAEEVTAAYTLYNYLNEEKPVCIYGEEE